MNNLVQTHTGLELSKKLAEVGCKLPATYAWFEPFGEIHTFAFGEITEKHKLTAKMYGLKFYPSYDILNDLCCKYDKKMFGEDTDNQRVMRINIFLDIAIRNRKQDAEYRIWEHCLFNPKNAKTTINKSTAHNRKA